MQYLARGEQAGVYTCTVTLSESSVHHFRVQEKHMDNEAFALQIFGLSMANWIPEKTTLEAVSCWFVLKKFLNTERLAAEIVGLPALDG